MERRTLPFARCLVEHVGRTVSRISLGILLLTAEAELLVLVLDSTIGLRAKPEISVSPRPSPLSCDSLSFLVVVIELARKLLSIDERVFELLHPALLA